MSKEREDKVTDELRETRTPEEELLKRYNLFGGGSILDPVDSVTIDNVLVTPRSTMWASLSPEDIDLIVNLVVGRLKKR